MSFILDKPQKVDHPAPPGSKEWCRLVTASKVPAILGMSPFQSQYGIWHQMNGIEPPEEHSMADRFLVGHILEPAMAAYWHGHNPSWRLTPDEVQVTNPNLPFPNAATPDRIATQGRKHTRRETACTHQYKSVTDWEEFSALRDGADIPDPWLVQICWEQLVSGLTEHPAQLVIVGPYLQFLILDVPYDAELANILIDEVAKFLHTLDGEPPEPALPRDVKIARAKHPDIEDRTVELPAELAQQWADAKATQKEAAAAKTAADKHADIIAAQVLDTMAGAAAATRPDGEVVATRTANKKGVVTLRAKTPKASP